VFDDDNEETWLPRAAGRNVSRRAAKRETRELTEAICAPDVTAEMSGLMHAMAQKQARDRESS
jgi:hypothetical protein